MNKRNIGIDLLRVFCCFGIIILHESGRIIEHLFYWNVTNSFIRPCLMVFFSISGYFILSKKIESLSKYYLHEIPKLVIPLIIYSWFYAIPIESIKTFDILNVLKSLNLQAILSGDQVGILWFVYSMIGFYIIAPFIQVLLHNLSDKKLLYFFIILCIPTILFPTIKLFSGITIGIEVPMASVGFMFFIFGYVLRRIDFQKYRKKIYLIGIINVLLTLLIFIQGQYVSYMANNSVSLVIYVLFYFLLFNDLSKKIKGDFIKKVIVHLSGRTFGIYMIHYFVFYTLLPKIEIFKLTDNNYWFMIIIRYFVIFVISMLMTYVLDYLIVKPTLYLLNKVIVWTKDMTQSFCKVMNQKYKTSEK